MLLQLEHYSNWNIETFVIAKLLPYMFIDFSYNKIFFHTLDKYDHTKNLRIGTASE